jgi:hypothetical protein
VATGTRCSADPFRQRPVGRQKAPVFPEQALVSHASVIGCVPRIPQRFGCGQLERTTQSIPLLLARHASRRLSDSHS